MRCLYFFLRRNGPYEVTVKYSDVTYGVKNDVTGYEKPVHIDRMKLKIRREDMDDVEEGIGWSKGYV